LHFPGGSLRIQAEVKLMKAIPVKLPDRLIIQLKTLASTLRVSEDELIARSLEEYLPKLEQGNEFKPIGFGMWADREEMEDSGAWVRKLRETEWQR
jgi:hypothetical protein